MSGAEVYGPHRRSVGSITMKKALAVAPKGRSKSAAPTRKLIDEDTDVENDPTYVLPTGRTSPTAPQTTRNQSKAASSDEATSAGDIRVPQNTDPTLVAEKPNKWCVEGHDNVLKWDRAVMVAALVTGFEIDFAHMLIAEIHERAFKASTTYPFPCLILQLCRDSGVLGTYPTPPATTDDAQASPSQVTSRALSSSRATPSSGFTVVPFVRVQIFEAQIETLLQHSLSHHPPTTNVSFLRKELDSLQPDLDKILVPPTHEPESSPTIPGDDTVLDALFREDLPQPKSTHAQGKRPHSSCIYYTIEDARIKKWERQHTDQARRASIVDEELCL
uniref:Integrase core domain containing protein n=1 Tax=Solanum tuberosum TaxID=4113 RepID=M1DGJ9_SOLTU